MDGGALRLDGAQDGDKTRWGARMGWGAISVAPVAAPAAKLTVQIVADLIELVVAEPGLHSHHTRYHPSNRILQ